MIAGVHCAIAVSVWQIFILLFLKARIVAGDAACPAQWTFKTEHPFAPDFVASFRQFLFAFKFRLESPLVYPLSQWSFVVLVVPERLRGCCHQIPTHKRERGNVASIHSQTL